MKRPVVKSTISTVEEAIELITQVSKQLAVEVVLDEAHDTTNCPCCLYMYNGQVLRQDIRGVNQGRGNTRPVVRSYIEHLVTGGSQKVPGDNSPHSSCDEDITMMMMEGEGDDRSRNIYTCTLDMFHLQFETTDAEIVVHRISLSDNYTQLM